MEVATPLFVLVGVIIGAILPRIVARVGSIYCEAKATGSSVAEVGGSTSTSPTLPIDLYERDLGSLIITFYISVDLFSEKEFATGLKDLTIVLRGKDEKLELPLLQNESEDSEAERAEFRVVNLPPGKFVHLNGKFNLEIPNLPVSSESLRGMSVADFCGRLPNGTTFCRRIEFPVSFD